MMLFYMVLLLEIK